MLVLLRHGQSEWNQKNIFTGWVDIPLSERGVEEALQAGEQMKDIEFDAIFTSELVRAQMTVCLSMLKNQSKRKIPLFISNESWVNEKARAISSDLNPLIPVNTSWHLNERMYGDLQGMNKDIARKEFGEEQVHIWRRSFDIAPPNGESLKMTMERTLPYFQEFIQPRVEKGENILISAHGNSLRSIVYALLQMTPETILQYEIPTGKPLFFEYAEGKFVVR